MPAKAIVTGIVLVILMFMLAYMAEFFLPLSIKAEMDMLCRSALLKMENTGGMNTEANRELRERLEDRGFTDVLVSAPGSARQGELMVLHVEGDFSYKKLTTLFKRENVKQRMVYEKASMARKVVN